MRSNVLGAKCNDLDYTAQFNNGIWFYSAFDIFHKVILCLALFKKEVKFANFCHDLMQKNNNNKTKQKKTKTKKQTNQKNKQTKTNKQKKKKKKKKKKNNNKKLLL